MYTIRRGPKNVTAQRDRTIDLAELRQKIARLEADRRPTSHTVISSGVGALDKLLSGGGFHRGTLVEWLAAGEGSASGTLALLAAQEAIRPDGLLTVLDRKHEFYPPAAVRLGIEPERLLVVHTENAADHDWAMDQVLRSPAVAAVLAWPEHLDGRTFRRWQLAVEQGGGIGLLLRSAAAAAEPSWADVRLLIEPQKPPPVVASQRRGDGRLLKISLLRCRGGIDGRSVDVELDD
jgi:protein ImuA